MVNEEEAVLLNLSDSRTIVRIVGNDSRKVLAKGISIDLHADVFPIQATAHTMVENIGVLLHRVDLEVFELYIPRSYSANVWSWLTRSAEEFGYQVEV